jgi:hypothetical protein
MAQAGFEKVSPDSITSGDSHLSSQVVSRKFSPTLSGRYHHVKMPDGVSSRKLRTNILVSDKVKWHFSFPNA